MRWSQTLEPRLTRLKVGCLRATVATASAQRERRATEASAGPRLPRPSTSAKTRTGE